MFLSLLGRKKSVRGGGGRRTRRTRTASDSDEDSDTSTCSRRSSSSNISVTQHPASRRSARKVSVNTGLPTQ